MAVAPAPSHSAAGGQDRAAVILDAIDPLTDQALHAAADDLLTHLGRLEPDTGSPAASSPATPLPDRAP